MLLIAMFCQYWVWMSDNPKPGILPKPRPPPVATSYLPSAIEFLQSWCITYLIHIYSISLLTPPRIYNILGNIINNIPLKWDYMFPCVPWTQINLSQGVLNIALDHTSLFHIHLCQNIMYFHFHFLKPNTFKFKIPE